MSSPAPSTMRRDLASAYLASAAKIGSWVVALGIVYRFVGVAEFALLALIRGTIGILNYTSLGLAPAMIRLLAETRAGGAEEAAKPGVIAYYAPTAEQSVQKAYANGLIIALMTGAMGTIVSVVYASVFADLYRMPLRLEADMYWPVLWIGIGTVLRLMSDAPGSLLQAHGQIAKDNWRLVEAEAAWLIFIAAAMSTWFLSNPLADIGFAYALSGLLLHLRRTRYAQQLTELLLPRLRLVDTATLKLLLSSGSMVLLAQLADYLYAPTDYILINLLIGWEDVAIYTPAMTIDAGLLLLVTGLSNVLLPRTAIAHTAGRLGQVRRYYVRGTLASAAMLALAGLAVWLICPWILRLWLGDPMPATQAILPLVLIHTVVGGSGAVGRSILLGMGKVKPFTIAAIVSGVANVVLSYCFVRFFGWGLYGIVIGTIVVVIARAGLWMPWYVLKTLRESEAPIQPADPMPPPQAPVG